MKINLSKTDITGHNVSFAKTNVSEVAKRFLLARNLFERS